MLFFLHVKFSQVVLKDECLSIELFVIRAYDASSACIDGNIYQAAKDLTLTLTRIKKNNIWVHFRYVKLTKLPEIND